MNIKTDVASSEDTVADVSDIMKRALADALLRHCDGRLRVCGKSALSASEEEWVQDIVSMVERFSKSHSRSRSLYSDRLPALKPLTHSPIARALEGRRSMTTEGVPAEGDFVYVPMACGPRGDYFGDLDSLRRDRIGEGQPEGEGEA